MNRKSTVSWFGRGACALALVLGGSAVAQQETKPQEEGKEPAKPASEEKKVDPMTEIKKFISERKIDKAKENWRTSLPKPPKLEFDAKKTYFWNLKTNKGEVKVKLLPAVAPMHVSSTIYLTELGFYDGLIFHRVIPGFMAQGGCPLGTGTGGPGYNYDGECDPKVKHDKPGLLSMANTGRPGSDGSQFFLTFVPTPNLNGKHTIFGEVTSGMETLKALEAKGSSPSGTTSEKLLIEKATISVE